MNLDRNETPDGFGKYVLINARKLMAQHPDAKTFNDLPQEIQDAFHTLEKAGAVEYGLKGSIDEFFPIKLRDAYARPALMAYALACEADDPDFSTQVRELADRSGRFNVYCKKPD